MLQLFGELEEMLRIWLLLAVVAQIKPTAVPVWAQPAAAAGAGMGTGACGVWQWECWHTAAAPFCYLHG